MELLNEFNIAVLGVMAVAITVMGKGFDLGVAVIKKKLANGTPSLREEQRDDIRKIKEVLIEGVGGSPSLVSQVQMNTRLLTDHLNESRARQKN